MASTIASEARDKFSELLSVFGETVTVSLRATESTATYDSAMRLVDTTTVFGTATAYTAVVQVNSFDPRVTAAFEGMGLKGREVAQIFFRYNVAVEEGDRIATATGGKTYIVRWAPESEDSYRTVLAARVEGMEGV